MTRIKIIKFMFKLLKILIILCFTYNLYSQERNPESINEVKFIIGQYNVEKQNNFVNLRSIGIPTNRDNIYLQKEVAEQLLKMYQQLIRDIPSAKLWIISATRTYWDQKNIWERKWNQYKNHLKNKKDIAKKILEYSSMPGTSRHHWGTDFDINILENSYYEKGEGKIIYEWLVKNAKNYGFCMPYNENRTEGYRLERWHWSYKKLARIYLEQWNQYYNKNIMQHYVEFKGREFFEDFAPIYVNSINRDCLD